MEIPLKHRSEGNCPLRLSNRQSFGNSSVQTYAFLVMVLIFSNCDCICCRRRVKIRKWTGRCTKCVISLVEENLLALLIPRADPAPQRDKGYGSSRPLSIPSQWITLAERYLIQRSTPPGHALCIVGCLIAKSHSRKKHRQICITTVRHSLHDRWKML